YILSGHRWPPTPSVHLFLVGYAYRRRQVLAVASFLGHQQCIDADPSGAGATANGCPPANSATEPSPSEHATSSSPRPATTDPEMYCKFEWTRRSRLYVSAILQVGCRTVRRVPSCRR